jgi:predicted porin
MKKKLLAVAVVGALASPVAFGQTLYGILDVGYQNAKHADGDVNKDFVSTGMKDSSRFGVRGSEDLAGGTYAMYQIEFDIVADTGATRAAGMTNRLTMVGLGSKAWGELTLGRQYTHIFHNNNFGQASGTETFASAASLVPRTVRASNSIKYSSPVMGGFSIGAIWAPGATDGAAPVAEPTAAGVDHNYWDVGVLWRPGPFGAGAAYGVFTEEVGGAETETTLTNLTVSFATGAFDIRGHYAMGETEAPIVGTTDDVNAWSISALMRLGGANEIRAMYGQLEDDAVSGDEADFWGLAFVHNMSKRTRLYAGYGSVSNDGGLALVPSGFAAPVAAGYNPRGFQVGISHSF